MLTLLVILMGTIILTWASLLVYTGMVGCWAETKFSELGTRLFAIAWLDHRFKHNGILFLFTAPAMALVYLITWKNEKQKLDSFYMEYLAQNRENVLTW